MILIFVGSAAAPLPCAAARAGRRVPALDPIVSLGVLLKRNFSATWMTRGRTSEWISAERRRRYIAVGESQLVWFKEIEQLARNWNSFPSATRYS